MISFKLNLPQLNSLNKISYKSNLFFIGSCFSENIAGILNTLDFRVYQNPFGILFHPVAIFSCLNRIIHQHFLAEHDLVYHQELWHSLEHHSDFSHYDKNSCLQNINDRLQKAHLFLKNTNYLFITLGSSIVYELTENGTIVSNCHKIEAKKFNKRFLSIDEIDISFQHLYQQLMSFNPELKIVFTISPVRHWRDGLIENNRSKARLICCIDEWCNRYDNVSYFPAYELVIDDLRDYRFYTNDWCHPNNLAIDYVLDYFSTMYFDETTLAYIRDKKELQNMLQHNVKFEQTNSSKMLKEKILNKENYIKNKYY